MNNLGWRVSRLVALFRLPVRLPAGGDISISLGSRVPYGKLKFYLRLGGV